MLLILPITFVDLPTGYYLLTVVATIDGAHVWAEAPEPCPCLLVITEAPVGLVFEQTEHTMKYLGIGSSYGLAGIGTHDI